MCVCGISGAPHRTGKYTIDIHVGMLLGYAHQTTMRSFNSITHTHIHRSVHRQCGVCACVLNIFALSLCVSAVLL